MKTFTATPEEFATGKVSVRAVDLFRNRKPRKPSGPRKPDPSLGRQIGVISPENFALGRPYFGRRVRGHRKDAVYTMKPLPESVVDILLEER